MTEVKAYQSRILTQAKDKKFCKLLKWFCKKHNAIIITLEESVAVDMNKVKGLIKKEINKNDEI